MGNRPHRLAARPVVRPEIGKQLENDFERFASGGLPSELESYLLETYRIDLASTYAGLPIKNPWGKASGQLSMRIEQVADDVQAGLGFVVLKTVIAEDASGEQAMRDWAIRESHMLAERIRGTSGDEGWTISWKGRGWWQPFDAYLDLVRDARALGDQHHTLIAPSCKYHLPTPDEQTWKQEEYRYTTRRLLEAYLGDDWNRTSADAASESGGASSATSPTGFDASPPVMPLEKDFSPTLAGSDRAAAQNKILEWLRVVPRLVREAASPNDQPGLAAQGGEAECSRSPIRIGLKLFNALFDDAFQVALLESVHQAGADRPDWIVYCNRLFDPDRRFKEHQGIAYGGPDLSDRNLRCLDAFFAARQRAAETDRLLEISATGDVCSGKMAMEYALRGCANFQLHTLFQLPGDQYAMRVGNKTQKALHLLYFHPQTGLVAWMHHIARQWEFPEESPVRFDEIIRTARSRLEPTSPTDV